MPVKTPIFKASCTMFILSKPLVTWFQNRDSQPAPRVSLQRGGNAALDKMVSKLEPIKEKHADISYADMYTFAGKARLQYAYNMITGEIHQRIGISMGV